MEQDGILLDKSGNQGLPDHKSIASLNFIGSVLLAAKSS